MKFLVYPTLLAMASLAALPTHTTARPTFVQLIPSGSSVQGVRALGHQSSSGGGVLNVFGAAFEANNFQWTTTLCQADSDRDGATNGEELGDPCCSWQPGSPTSTQAPITHPGVANSFSATDLTAMRCLRTTAGTETQPGVPSDIPGATEPTTVPGTVDDLTLTPTLAVAGSGSTSSQPSASPVLAAPSSTTKKSSATDKPAGSSSAATPLFVARGLSVTLPAAIMMLCGVPY